MCYVIKNIDKTEIKLNSSVWENIKSIAIDKINWSDMYPTYIKTDAKLLHNNDGIYVKFESEEHPIHINYRYHNGEIYKDSTVEIFIAPNKNSVNYFNFEINAEGYALIGYGPGRKRNRLTDIDFSQFRIESNIHNKGFELQLFIPYSFIREYESEISTEVRCNLQKCCELEGYMHFLSAYPITTEKPEFHSPQCFSKFIIE